MSNIVKDGWMNKEGSGWKSWKMRYFTLTESAAGAGAVLTYYEDEGKLKKKGAYSLTSSTTTEIASGKGHYLDCFMLKGIRGENRSNKLKCSAISTADRIA